MDQFDNAINKQIISGNFPNDRLYPGDIVTDPTIDIEVAAKEALDAMESSSEFSYVWFSAFITRIKEVDSLNLEKTYEHEINIIVNTGFDPNLISPISPLYKKAIELKPMITDLDKAFWFGIASCSTELMVSPGENAKQICSMMYACIYLLHICEKKEAESGLTINTKEASADKNIVELILSDWTDNAYFTEINENEKSELRRLFKEREVLKEELVKERNESWEIAVETSSEWKLFLEIINDLALHEIETITIVKETDAPKDKVRAISNYEKIVAGIERGIYSYNGEDIELFELLEKIIKRLTNAACFCTAKTDTGKSFIMHPSVAILLRNPYTYNYLLMSFHKFRMSPGKDTGRKFFRLAALGIKKNLGDETKPEDLTVDRLIADIYDTVTSFLQNHKEDIDQLNYSTIMAGSLSVGALNTALSEDEMNKAVLSGVIESARDSNEIDKQIADILSGRSNAAKPEELKTLLAEQNKTITENEKRAVARQLILSMDAVYLVSDAIRISLNNKHANIKIKDRNAAENYRKEFRKLDVRLIRKVYSGLDDAEIGMLEYRERAGIDATEMAEREADGEKYRNSLFGETLRGAITDLSKSISEQNTEGLIELKKKIRDEIFECPDCGQKEEYANWLDEISERFCEALINKTKGKDDFSAVRADLEHLLGDRYVILPEDTMDSLTTAEMLYRRYATKEYEEKGFDYSSISALYYQAFEAAYNKLIWKGYADRLNALVINDKAYTEIIHKNRKELTDPDQLGYLDADGAQRSFYVEYASKKKNRARTSVLARCMYTSFAIIMAEIHVGSRLDKFCDYFAEITGFKDRNEMFSDATFMSLCDKFTDAINVSAGNRNNASHGGSDISMQQCTEDKQVVLNNLETVRGGVLGLIEQLLDVLKNMKADE